MAREYKRVVEILGFVPCLGDILLFNDFERGHNFTIDSSYAPKVIRSVEEKFTGFSSLKAYESEESAENTLLTLELRVPYIYPKKHRFQFYFNIPDTSRFKSFQIRADYFTGSKLKPFGINYDVTNTKLQYMHEEDLFTDILGGAYNLYSGGWNKFEFSYNVSNDKYIDLILNGSKYDLSSYSATEKSSSITPRLFMRIIGKATGAQLMSFFIDNILIKVI